MQLEAEVGEEAESRSAGLGGGGRGWRQRFRVSRSWKREGTASPGASALTLTLAYETRVRPLTSELQGEDGVLL